MPKTQTKPGLSPRELDALRKRYLAEQKQAESASKWRLANDIASGINDIVGRGVIAPIAGVLGDVNQALWDAGAWVNNKIKDVEYATGMVKPDLSSLVTGQRKGYIPYSQGNAYLGSEDIGNRMERAGLVSSERRPMTELAASLVSPSAAAKTAINAPKTAMNMLRMADNLEAPSRGVRTADGMYIPRGQMGAIENLYHGSPHTFDRFDLSKIGTGEGAQAYGHGAYLAESPDVAHGYQYSTQTPEILIKGDSWKGDQSGVYRNPDGQHEGYLDDVSYSAIKALAGSRPDKSLVEIAGDAERFLLRRGEPQANIDSVKKAILSGDISLVKNDGNIYQARLAWPDAAREAADPLSPDHFLHWDKPLSEQTPYVQDAFNKAIELRRNALTPPEDPERWMSQIMALDSAKGYYTGGGSSKALSASFPMEDTDAMRETSRLLAEQGIPGIRYLDAGSRGAGSHNYVVFDDKLIDIVSRNNQPIVKPGAPTDKLNSLNPTSGVFVDYNPNLRATQPLGERMTTLDKTMGGSADDIITIYRGAPKNQKGIVPGDFVTTIPELAKSYSGDGHVLKMSVRRGDVLDDITDPMGGEYIYRPQDMGQTATKDKRKERKK